MRRHTNKIMDGAALMLVVLLALFYVYEVDVFDGVKGGVTHANTIEVTEMMLVAAVFCGGLSIFALRRLAEQKRETARRTAAEEEVRALAYSDPLTGLANRRQFDAALVAAVQAPPRAGASHAVISLDLNGFKKVNDLHGHAVGDEVLIRVAARLRECVREGDLVARLGGDEFAILSLHLGSAEAATSLALRVVEAMRAQVPAGTVEHVIGIGVGIALAPQDGNTSSELLRKADVALYRAKHAGGSAMCFFEPAMDASIRERDALERHLRAAVHEKAIVPWYQPLVDLKTGRLRGFEALARWTGPAARPVGPERFIPITEEIGLIGELNDYMLERACRDASDWPKHLELAFNVSPYLLRDPTFPARVLSILARTGFPARRLELEITESALVRDLVATQAALGGLRAAGVRIALDDFGTGYSSLFHLRNFRVDRLKIDRSFVEAMTHDRDSAAIVRALVGLGEGLGLEVTAEGVENADQRQLLEQHGCNQAQGFFYGAAMPAARVIIELTSGAWNAGEAHQVREA